MKHCDEFLVTLLVQQRAFCVRKIQQLLITRVDIDQQSILNSFRLDKKQEGTVHISILGRATQVFRMILPTNNLYFHRTCDNYESQLTAMATANKQTVLT